MRTMLSSGLNKYSKIPASPFFRTGLMKLLQTDSVLLVLAW